MTAVLPLLVMLVAVASYLWAGRILLAHTHQSHEATPLRAFLVGAALWCFWWLGGQAMGLGSATLWWLYLTTVLALTLVLGKAHLSLGHTAVFSGRVWLLLLLIAPWALALLGHHPHYGPELNFMALWPGWLAHSGGLPSSAIVEDFYLYPAAGPQTLAWLTLPASVMAGGYHDAFTPLLNLILLGLLATEFLRWRGVTPTWDNLWVTLPVTLLLIIGLVYVLAPQALLSAMPYTLLAAVAFCAWCQTQQHPLPQGLAALGLAFTLALLPHTASIGLPLALVLLVIVAWRWLRAQPGAGATLLLLVMVPTALLGLWLQLVHQLGYPYAGQIFTALTPTQLSEVNLQGEILTLALLLLLGLVITLGRRLAINFGFHGLGVGSGLVIIGLTLALGVVTWPTTPSTGPVAHVRGVAGALPGLEIAPRSTIAVLDPNPQTALLLKAAAPTYAITVVAPQTSLATLQQQLQRLNADYLWVHTPTPELRALLDTRLAATASYLYEVSQTGLILRATFPHPEYAYQP